jgi:uncharacterized protein
MLRIVAIAVLIFLGYRLVTRWLRQLDNRPADHSMEWDQGHDVSEMVRDPVCGTYVPVNEAISVHTHGTVVHFCSEECRRRYLESQR